MQIKSFRLINASMSDKIFDDHKIAVPTDLMLDLMI